MESDPHEYYDFRFKIERQLASSFAGLWSGTAASARFTSIARAHMSSKVHDKSTLDALVPNFAAGCRRFTPSDSYLEALNQPNVRLIRSPITHADTSTLHTSGGSEKESYDLIICATGFDAYTPRFNLVGRDGIHLSDVWSPEGSYGSYMAASVAGFPNFFGKCYLSNMSQTWINELLIKFQCSILPSAR